MTKESLLKKQGWISVERRSPLKSRLHRSIYHRPMYHRPMYLRLSLFSLLGALFSAGCLADESYAPELPSFNGEARTASGDVVRIPLGQQAGSPNVGPLPRMGVSRDAVLRQLGEPRQRRAAVGEPPISSWEYADVVVYFEHDHVIHAVRKHVPLTGRQ